MTRGASLAANNVSYSVKAKYRIVHHDAEYKTVHHDAVTHTETYCTGCGVEIGIKRLEARPTATLCIDCKTLEEVRERQVAK